MVQPLIECIPNFSEGRDGETLARIAASIRSVDGVRLLEVDPGPGANRTVMTFAGSPAVVTEAAFRAIRTAAERIDMRLHRGAHPRLGATDVCPLVPLAGISAEALVPYSLELGRRVAALGIPVYLYEQSATRPHTRSLSSIRRGEYEGLAAKLREPRWKPDFGEAVFNARSGATVIGVRDFLVAYNVNLDTADAALAEEVACDVRERGRVRLVDGKPVREAGKLVYDPGRLKHVRGIGWFIEEYGIAQVSMNLTHLGVTPVHLAFEACREAAALRGLRVTGSELVGLIPLASLLEAGSYFLGRSGGHAGGRSETELVALAVASLGLDALRPFDPGKKVIEYLLQPGGGV